VVAAAVVVVSMGEVSAVALSMAVVLVAVVSMEDVSAVAVSTAVAFVGEVSAVALSTAVAFAATVLVMTDSLMMSSSATSAFRGGGVIRTDITVTTITHTITMATDMEGTRTTTMDTAGTVTTVAPGTVTTVALVMDFAMEAERVTDTALAPDQRMPGVEPSAALVD
jgi:hypothetical protein